MNTRAAELEQIKQSFGEQFELGAKMNDGFTMGTPTIEHV
jgi:hypothetical protein